MSECQEWQKSRRPNGYGQVRVAGKMQYAHRAAWEEHHGPIPNRMLVLHRCDNRACVNLDHLFLGTHADNVQDMLAKDRGVDHRGSKHPRSILTEEQVREIRASDIGPYALGRLYSVAPQTICNIKSRVTWRHIP